MKNRKYLTTTLMQAMNYRCCNLHVQRYTVLHVMHDTLEKELMQELIHIELCYNYNSYIM